MNKEEKNDSESQESFNEELEHLIDENTGEGENTKLTAREIAKTAFIILAGLVEASAAFFGRVLNKFFSSAIFGRDPGTIVQKEVNAHQHRKNRKEEDKTEPEEVQEEPEIETDEQTEPQDNSEHEEETVVSAEKENTESNKEFYYTIEGQKYLKEILSFYKMDVDFKEEEFVINENNYSLEDIKSGTLFSNLRSLERQCLGAMISRKETTMIEVEEGKHVELWFNKGTLYSSNNEIDFKNITMLDERELKKQLVEGMKQTIVISENQKTATILPSEVIISTPEEHMDDVVYSIKDKKDILRLATEQFSDKKREDSLYSASKMAFVANPKLRQTLYSNAKSVDQASLSFAVQMAIKERKHEKAGKTEEKESLGEFYKTSEGFKYLDSILAPIGGEIKREHKDNFNVNGVTYSLEELLNGASCKDMSELDQAVMRGLLQRKNIMLPISLLNNVERYINLEFKDGQLFCENTSASKLFFSKADSFEEELIQASTKEIHLGIGKNNVVDITPSHLLFKASGNEYIVKDLTVVAEIATKEMAHKSRSEAYAIAAMVAFESNPKLMQERKIENQFSDYEIRMAASEYAKELYQNTAEVDIKEEELEKCDEMKPEASERISKDEERNMSSETER